MGIINISQVTTTLTTGDGVFDVLMRAVDAHLDKQYTSGRIKGTEYATVYLGSLTAVLQQAMAFVLAEQEAEKKLDLLDKELLVKTEQIAASQAETAVKQAQSASQIALQGAQKLSIEGELSIKQNELSLKQAQSAKDLLVKDEQILASNTDRTLKTAQSNKDLETKAEQISASQIGSAIKQQLANKQESVYDKQSKSFDQDYKYKMAKSLFDLRSTGLTQEKLGFSLTTGDGIVNAVMADAGLPINFTFGSQT